MRSIGRCLFGVAMATPIFIAACDRESASDRAGTQSSDKPSATFASRDTARKLGPGDILIANADSSIELGLYGDSIITGLGAKVLNEIREKTDTAGSGTGFAASIEKMVKNTVADALSHQIKYAVADVQDVRFEDGKLLFFAKDGSRMPFFENTKLNKKPVSQTFKPDDAQRFVAAFKARKAAGHG